MPPHELAPGREGPTPVNALPLPVALRSHPRLGQWLGLGPGGAILAYSGKVDIGQGISHALRLIVAAELGLPAERIMMQPASTACSPDEAVTSGSLSVQQSGAALRHAAAHLREACRSAMGRRHGLHPDAVVLSEGRFCACSGAAVSVYQELIDAAMLAEVIDPLHLAAGPAAQAHAQDPRPDVAAKVLGEFLFIQDLRWPDMLFGQVFRPQTLTATLDTAEALGLVKELKAVQDVLSVLQDGLLIGVIARTEHALGRAAHCVQRRQAQADIWHGRADVPVPSELTAWLRRQPLETTVVLERQDKDAEARYVGEKTHHFSALYARPYLQHASIGLCCAIARWRSADDALEVWSHSQGIFNLRRDLALAFGLPPAGVTVSHVEGAGCYGHNGADDVAFDAAWLARAAPGRAVRVLWSRAAEMGHAPLGPAMAVALHARAGLDGRLQVWSQEVWSQGHGTRPGRGQTPALLGAWQTATPFPVPMAVNAELSVGGGSERNAVPPYDIPQVLVRNHRVLSMPVRVSALRALGAHANVFAAESFMDEIAMQMSQDPLAYRLAHLKGDDHARAAAVLTEVARMAGWDASRTTVEGCGRGLAYARYKNTGAYCAVVVQLRVDDRVRLEHIWIAADLGLVVHADGARNQLEGGAIQAASWTICEQARVDSGGITSGSWDSYPILRFSEMPQVHVTLLDRPDCPSLGAGECTAGPVAAAIGNAIAQATGLRMRAMPFTADNLVKAALAEPD